MPIHPRNLPTTREEQQWNAVGDLRRQAAKLDRASVAAPQRGAVIDNTGGTADAASNWLTLGSIPVGIPNEASVVLMTWSVVHHNSAAGIGNISTLSVFEATDFPAGLSLNNVQNTTSPLVSAPRVLGESTVSYNTFNMFIWADPYARFAGTGGGTEPTPGTRTYDLKGRTSGGFTCLFDKVRFKVLVL